tara:strand:+ start:4422 stop:4772 length:351 start_codon:yes stop_codon:yes gene_type:complete
MAEIKVLVVTTAQLDLAEKSLNKYLGRYFAVTSEVMDGDDIDTVSVDISQLSQEANGSNVPTGDYIINADKLKRLYLSLSATEQATITSRFGGDIVTWIEANWQDKSAVIFYEPVI